MDIEEVLGGCAVLFLLCLIFIVAMVYFTVAGAVVLTSFWSWFLIPVFPNLPQITLVNAIGINMLWGALNSSFTRAIVEGLRDKTEEEEKGAKAAIALLMLIFAPWVTLLIGAIFHAVFM